MIIVSKAAALFCFPAYAATGTTPGDVGITSCSEKLLFFRVKRERGTAIGTGYNLVGEFH